MARGRMLNKSVSASKKFHLLPDDTCRLLATWTIAHLDINGVFYADPVMVKSLIFPRRGDVNIEQIELYIEAMQRIGLIILFEADGQLWQYWPGFADNQANLRTDREKSDFPAPVVGSGQPLPPPVESASPYDAGLIPAESPHNSGIMPDNGGPNINEINRTKTKTTGGSRRQFSSDDLQEVSTAYETNIGFISPMASDELKDLLETYGKAWILEAFTVAVKSNKRKLTYVEGILKRWHTEGKGPPGQNGHDLPEKEKRVFIDKATGRQLTE